MDVESNEEFGLLQNKNSKLKLKSQLEKFSNLVFDTFKKLFEKRKWKIKIMNTLSYGNSI